jgi:hypothetical protein
VQRAADFECVRVYRARSLPLTIQPQTRRKYLLETILLLSPLFAWSIAVEIILTA